MRKIKWKEITWYSKALSLVFFIVFLILSFYVGYWYGGLKSKESFLQLILSNYKPLLLGNFSDNANYEDRRNWLAFEDKNFGFSFEYPKELEPLNPVGSWRYFTSDNSLGIELVKLKIPAIYEANTNFVDATFSVGVSSSTSDIQNCFLPSSKEESLGTFDIGNKTFYKFQGKDSIAGHNYEIESYKTLHHNICYNLDLVIHSIDRGVFGEKYKEFDRERVYNLLKQVLETFVFTK